MRADEVSFELLLERVRHTTWLDARTPDTSPVYQRWRADPTPAVTPAVAPGGTLSAEGSP